MKRKLRLLAALGLLVLGLAVPAAVVARGEQASAPADAQTAEDTGDDAGLEEFEPTEEVDADEAISFPVDI